MSSNVDSSSGGDVGNAGDLRSTDPVGVATDDLAVEKTVDVHGNGAVKVVFTIALRCEEAVELVMRDPLPEGVRTADLDFHPGYDPENWTVSGSEHVRYEAVIEPGTERKTVYGALVSSMDQRESFREPPRVDVERIERAGPIRSEDGPRVTDEQEDEDDTRSDDEGGSSSDVRSDAGTHEGTSSVGEPVEHRSEVAVLEEHLASVEERVAEMAARLDDLERIERTVESLDAEFDELRTSVRSLERRHDSDVRRLERRADVERAAIEATTESMARDLAAVRQDVERAKRWRERLSGTVQLAPGRETGED